MKFDMVFKDINNCVATYGMINGETVIKDIMMMVCRSTLLLKVKMQL
jgi:hypothetical protein